MAPSRGQAKRWRALKRRKGRAEHGLFLAEGVRLVGDLLASNLSVRHALYDGEAAGDPGIGEAVARLEERGVPVEAVPRSELEEFADTVTPQGILAVAEIPERGWPELAGGPIVVLDRVQDPGNAGTLLRTAEALGAAGAVALRGTVDVWNPKVVRASAGSVFRLPVLSATWPEAEERFAERSLPLWAADPEGEPVTREEPRPERLALVFGNEGAGVREEILRRADRRVAVAVAGSVESLNVAVAAAILMDRLLGDAGGPGSSDADRPGPSDAGGPGSSDAGGPGSTDPGAEGGRHPDA